MRPDKPRRNPVGWLRIAREGLFWRWRVLKTDCKLPARRGEAEARGSFVIRETTGEPLTEVETVCYNTWQFHFAINMKGELNGNRNCT